MNIFLNISGGAVSAMCMFAKELSVQPALSAGIGSDEAAAVCPELC